MIISYYRLGVRTTHKNKTALLITEKESYMQGKIMLYVNYLLLWVDAGESGYDRFDILLCLMIIYRVIIN